MDNTQFITLISLMGGGFGWIIMWLRAIDKSIMDMDRRLTIIETVMMCKGILPNNEGIKL